MLDRALRRKKLSVRMTIKGALALLFCVMAVALPQITHAIGGAQAGTVYMPMYLPALLAGCMLGWQWGLGVGLLSPIMSYGFTVLCFGEAMPALSRLPYMTLEIGLYGLVTGLFSGITEKHPLFAFPAVIAAQLSGRTAYVVYNLIVGRAFGDLMSSVAAGLPGLYLQAVIAPAVIIFISWVIGHEQTSRNS